MAATNYPGVTYSEANDVRHMVNFVRAHPHTFNPRWTLARARAEEQNWHGGGPSVTEVVERTGVPLDTVIDYTPLPLLSEYSGLSFVALCKLERRCARKGRCHAPLRCVLLAERGQWQVAHSTRSMRTAGVSRRWRSLDV